MTDIITIVGKGIEYCGITIDMGTPGGEALAVTTAFMLFCALLSFVVSLITGSVSQTDKLWSITPFIYSWVFAFYAQFEERLTTIAILVTIWGVRLSLNFARKGGYTGSEDYRWPIMRSRITNPVAWLLFNFFFISFYQHFLILLITLPSYTIMMAESPMPHNILDYVAIISFVVLLLGEIIADEQMWDYQEAKHGKRPKKAHLKADYARGFFSSGLYSLSRHPNYFCELGLWVCYYLIGVAATGVWMHATIAGPVLLILLFQASTGLAEGISLSKYPKYAEYQRNTSRLLPWLPGRFKE